jgi:hypothetical protein
MRRRLVRQSLSAPLYQRWYVIACVDNLTEKIFVICNMCVIQSSIFVSVKTRNQVKLITKVIYTCVNYMFRPLLGHHQVYLCVLRS